MSSSREAAPTTPWDGLLTDGSRRAKASRPSPPCPSSSSCALLFFPLLVQDLLSLSFLLFQENLPDTGRPPYFFFLFVHFSVLTTLQYSNLY